MSKSTSMSRKSADKPLARVSSVSTIPHSPITSHPLNARVVEWQTRTFEGRMPKGMRVQVPPRALLLLNISKSYDRRGADRCTRGRVRSPTEKMLPIAGQLATACSLERDNKFGKNGDGILNRSDDIVSWQ